MSSIERRLMEELSAKGRVGSKSTEERLEESNGKGSR